MVEEGVSSIDRSSIALLKFQIFLKLVESSIFESTSVKKGADKFSDYVGRFYLMNLANNKK